MSPSHVPTSHRPRRRHLLALGAAALLIPAAPASAATVSIKVSDPSGDQAGAPGLDITGATISQNTGTGAVTATISYAAAPPEGATFALALGSSDNDCQFDENVSGAAAVIGAVNAGAVLVISGTTTAAKPISVSTAGSTLKISTGSNSGLKKLKWDCARVSIQMQGASADQLLGDDGVANGPSLGGSQVVVRTDKPDGDKDGVPDVTDACPTVPGSTANGCLAIAAKKAFRLGSKRLVIDRMVKSKGGSCGATAKATVSEKKGRKTKTIGKTSLSVGVHGDYCHISGIVKIKKHGKKVKLTVKGTGFTSFKKNVKASGSSKTTRKSTKKSTRK